ncbi:unnamed protein product [marine sediment metagenome]|uniref:Uncharacterized protein n=1 Tax=marine sediment metagenome TaxID=412755 RepID=X0T8J0_9ZZZZ
MYEINGKPLSECMTVDLAKRTLEMEIARVGKIKKNGRGENVNYKNDTDR